MTPAPSTTVAPSRSPDALVFREVIATLPYGGSGQQTCNSGKRVTPNKDDTLVAKQVILRDRKKTVCYVLGPALLTARDIASADATTDPTTGAWQVSVHFSNDDFVNTIGLRMVGKNVAIILDHVVQSAPLIKEQITTPDVQIAGNFSEAEARAIADALR